MIIYYMVTRMMTVTKNLRGKLLYENDFLSVMLRQKHQLHDEKDVYQSYRTASGL